MTRRWWLTLAVLVVVLGIASVLLRKSSPRDITLPVLNKSEQTVQLLFYGDGLTEHALIQSLPPQTGLVITLRLARSGAVRLKGESERAQVDTLLLKDNATLREQSLQFEVRNGNQFVLVPR